VASRQNGIHTTPNPSGDGWVNQGGGRILSRHHTKGTAVERGRELAQARQTEHLIHNADGQIGRRNSYGHDPVPPRDRNR
jgi:hypothetical protein